jgi:cysteine-rich repeat protein
MFINGTKCAYCSASCLGCSSLAVCTSCPAGFNLDGSGGCVCGPACTSCAGNVTSCSQCALTVTSGFGGCTACSPGTYLISSTICSPCPGNCVTCSSGGLCTSCPATLEPIGGLCECNNNSNLFFNTVTSLCELCSVAYPNCLTCMANLSSSVGFSCSLCEGGYYWVNETCSLEVCGDGIVSPMEQCDDGNSLSYDGCAYCKVEAYYNCYGEPSICLVVMDFKIEFDSVEASTLECNQITVFFRLSPAYSSFDSVDFSPMYAFVN